MKLVTQTSPGTRESSDDEYERECVKNNKHQGWLQVTYNVLFERQWEINRFTQMITNQKDYMTPYHFDCGRRKLYTFANENQGLTPKHWRRVDTDLIIPIIFLKIAEVEAKLGVRTTYLEQQMWPGIRYLQQCPRFSWLHTKLKLPRVRK